MWCFYSSRFPVPSPVHREVDKSGSCKFATRSDKLPVTRRCRATDGMSWGNNVDCMYFCYHPLNKSDTKKNRVVVFLLIIYFCRGNSSFWGMLQLSQSLEGVGQSNTEDTGDYYSRKYIVAFTGKLFWSSLLGCVYQKCQSKYLEAKFSCWTSRNAFLRKSHMSSRLTYLSPKRQTGSTTLQIFFTLK